MEHASLLTGKSSVVSEFTCQFTVSKSEDKLSVNQQSGTFCLLKVYYSVIQQVNLEYTMSNNYYYSFKSVGLLLIYQLCKLCSKLTVNYLTYNY